MKNKLKIQIIGWLLLIVSMLVAGSMIGYDLTEEPSLVAQKINNPFNILGVYIGFYLMKLGFGYAALLFPVIIATVSYYLISNFSFNLLKLLKFQLCLLVLLSITLSFFNNLSSLSELKLIEDYGLSGLLGGLLLGLIFDWTGFFGSILILFSSYVLIIVTFFEIDLFKKLMNLPKNLEGLIQTINFDFKKLNINVSVINPGFIDTESTKLNSFKMPMLKTPEYAAQKIYRGLTGKYRFEIYFPFIIVFSVKVMRILPLKIYSFIWKKLGNF